MQKKRGINSYCATVDKKRLLKQADCCETLIFICSELEIEKMQKLFSQERTVILPVDGGFSGIAEEDEENKQWLQQFLQNQHQLRHVLICAHYDCRLLEPAAGAYTNGSQSACSEPGTIENLVATERARLQCFTSNALPDNPPTVDGCLYDDEFDWLTFYDQETGLFLPANAFASAPLNK